MNEKNLNNIIECLQLRLKMYKEGSSTYNELKNAIDMLSAKCYRN